MEMKKIALIVLLAVFVVLLASCAADRYDSIRIYRSPGYNDVTIYTDGQEFVDFDKVVDDEGNITMVLKFRKRPSR